MKYQHKQNGYALLIVLIAIAILLILYATQMKTLFIPDLPKQQPVGIEERPWLLEEYLIPEDKNVKLPRSPKPQLNEPITLNAGVRRNDAERGTTVIDFDTNGRIRATWQSEYSHDEQAYSITAEMAGNINVKRTYEDPNGKDKSRLFFIAKGHYLKKMLNSGTEEKGTAYMLGWLKPDHTANGYITITTDRKWAAAYEFTTSPAEK